MINLVQMEYASAANIGNIIWWHRVFYLHVAGTVLIAGMLRADLHTSSVSQSWDMAMLALRSHAHMSPSVQQCITTFETLSTKISQAQQHPTSGKGIASDGGGCSTLYFQDHFQEIGFDLDNSLFGAEDMAWLVNFDR